MANKKELIEQKEEIEKLETFQEEEEVQEQKGTDLLFEDGPTYDMLAEWKVRNNNEVYMSDFDDEIFIWRPLRRKEYRDLNRVEGQRDEFYIEESICRACVLWPEEYGQHTMVFGKAGIPSTLSNLILERSGFGRPETYKL